jgi:hypothetical protein
LVEADCNTGIVVATSDLTELRRLCEEEAFRWR